MAGNHVCVLTLLFIGQTNKNCIVPAFSYEYVCVSLGNLQTYSKFTHMFL